MSTDSLQIREDEGGGGRYDAISSLTNMDENGSPAIQAAPQTPTSQQEEEMEIFQNNKRKECPDLDDISRTSRPKLGSLSTNEDIHTPAEDTSITGTTEEEAPVSSHVFVVEMQLDDAWSLCLPGTFTISV